jgi:hypothetical protein
MRTQFEGSGFDTVNTKESFKDSLRALALIIGVVAFGFSVLLAIWWGVWWAIHGSVPTGLFGISRWWDLLINPLAFLLIALLFIFVSENHFPYWFDRFGSKVLPIFYIIGTFGAFCFGIGLFVIVASISWLVTGFAFVQMKVLWWRRGVISRPPQSCVPLQ